jgi:hypothetical protein
MNRLTLFGLVAVTGMLVSHAQESRSRVYILGFAFACDLRSIFGFLQGAWPFGAVEAIGAMVAACQLDESSRSNLAQAAECALLSRGGGLALKGRNESKELFKSSAYLLIIIQLLLNVA